MCCSPVCNGRHAGRGTTHPACIPRNRGAGLSRPSPMGTAWRQRTCLHVAVLERRAQGDGGGAWRCCADAVQSGRTTALDSRHDADKAKPHQCAGAGLGRCGGDEVERLRHERPLERTAAVRRRSPSARVRASWQAETRFSPKGPGPCALVHADWGLPLAEFAAPRGIEARPVPDGRSAHRDRVGTPRQRAVTVCPCLLVYH